MCLWIWSYCKPIKIRKRHGCLLPLCFGHPVEQLLHTVLLATPGQQWFWSPSLNTPSNWKKKIIIIKEGERPAIRENYELQWWHRPCRKEQLPSPVFLPGESHEQRSLVCYSSWGCKEPDTTEWLTLLRALEASAPKAQGLKHWVWTDFQLPKPGNLCLNKPYNLFKKILFD